MTDSLEKGNQRRQPWPREAGVDHFPGNRGVMHAPTGATPGGQSPMFVDAKGHLPDLHLLEHARSGAGVLQGSTAVGAVIQCVGMSVVDLFRSERRTVVRFMAHLSATLSFTAVRRLVLGLLDDITGGRLGRSSGVLAGDRQVRSQSGDLR